MVVATWRNTNNHQYYVSTNYVPSVSWAGICNLGPDREATVLGHPCASVLRLLSGRYEPANQTMPGLPDEC